jgi:cytochrome c553
LRTPTRIAWTSSTLRQIAEGNVERGAFVAMNCTACHGEQGASSSSLYPTLAGMDAAVIYKQLDDFRAGERWWGAMNRVKCAASLCSTAAASMQSQQSSELCWRRSALTKRSTGNSDAHAYRICGCISSSVLLELRPHNPRSMACSKKKFSIFRHQCWSCYDKSPCML